MFPVETLRELQSKAVAAARGEIVTIPGNAREAFFVHNGTATPIGLPPALRQHEVCELDELCRYVKDRIATPGDDPKSIVVWHGRDEVVVILDDADRRDRVTLGLAKTNAWEWVEACDHTRPRLDAKEFLTLLKTTLDECVDPAALHDWQVALRNVRLTRKVASEQTTERGLEKLGREIQNECAGADAVPQVLMVSAAVYRNCGEVDVVADVTFDVSIDFDAGKFVLNPIGDRIANAVDACQHGIGEYVREKTGLQSVFHGTP